jgi:hypothetical protein
MRGLSRQAEIFEKSRIIYEREVIHTSRGVIDVGKDAPHPASGHLLPRSLAGEKGKGGYGDLPKRD